MNAPRNGAPSWRVVGVDIGGTFTDVVLVGDEQVVIRKLLTTPSDYSDAVLAGVHSACEGAGTPASALNGVVHATTVVTNALLEGNGARTALITTAGFRDVLEIGRLRRPSLYDLTWEPPTPLVPRALRLEADERVAASGEVIRPLDEAPLRQSIEDLVRSQDIESIAVCLLHSYVNDVHERRVGELIAELAPSVHVSLSVDILPQIREFERTSTAVVNATVAPVVQRYLTRLEDRLTDIGVGATQDGDAPLMLMQSNGGVVPAHVAAQRPAALIESGPAAGALAGAILAGQRGVTDMIGLDIGGTTAKAFLVEQGRLRETREMRVGAGLNAQSRLLQGGGYTISLPSIDIAEVGGGGGSIAWIDAGGSLKVGPHSAGSVPGPAAYGLGGQQPTVTDAFAVLGFLGVDGIAGGSQSIDIELARNAIEEHIAKPLGYSVLEAAWGIHLLNAASLIRVVRAVTTERGRDPRTMEVLAFGGAGPAQATEVLRQLGGKRVIVPPMTGVFSSFGLLLADLRFDFTQTVIRSLQDLGSNGVRAHFASLESLATDELHSIGILREALEFEHVIDMRYAGQANELGVLVPAGVMDHELVELFGREHEGTYGHRGGDDAIDVVAIRLQARRPGRGHSYSDLVSTIRAQSVTAPSQSTRSVYFGDKTYETAVIARQHLEAGEMEGPVIVAEYDSTIVVPPGFSVALDEIYNVVVEQRPSTTDAVVSQ